MIFIQILFIVFSIILFLFVIKNVNNWSSDLQKIYIKEGDKIDSTAGPQIWHTNFFRIMLKIGIVFSVLVLLSMAYSILFGSIQL